MDLSRECWTWREISEVFGVPAPTLYEWVRKYKQTGQTESHKHPGKPQLLNKKDLEVLKRLVRENTNATLDDLCELLARELGPDKAIKNSAMSKYLRRLGYSRKKRRSTLTSKTPRG